MKQFWPLSHENYPAKVDQLKIFDDQKIQNAFCTSFFVLTPRITFFRTKIWTFQISSTAKMSKFEKLVRKGPLHLPYLWVNMHITKIFSLGLVIFYPLKHRPFIEISPPLLPNQIMPKSEVFQLFIDSKSRISNKCSHFVYWRTSLVTLSIWYRPYGMAHLQPIPVIDFISVQILKYFLQFKILGI